MELNVNRIFNSRVLYNGNPEGNLYVTYSFWDIIQRVVSYFYTSSQYCEENRKTIACFKKYLVDTLGQTRLERICTRYGIDLDEMQKLGRTLTSRDVAKIVIGTKDVKVEDIIEAVKEPFQNLSSQRFQEIQKDLSRKLPWKVPMIKKNLSGAPSEFIETYFYDPLLADRERLQICKKNSKDTFETFMHVCAAYIIKKEPEVGMLIPAPNHKENHSKQFYVITAKLITAKGLVSYVLHPATKDTDLEPIRFFRGTVLHTGEVDAISSFIADIEEDLGKNAFESALKYENFIQEKLPSVTIEAGHSLGGLLTQHRLVHKTNPHVKQAVIISSPGLAKLEYVDTFNMRKDPLKLKIIHTRHDMLKNIGIHLGWNAPKNIEVEFYKFHPMKRGTVGMSNHVTVWGRDSKWHGIQGGLSEEGKLVEFYNYKNIKETIRSTIGPVLAKVLIALRDLWRQYLPSRAESLKGLQIASFKDLEWKVEHIRL